MDQECTFSWRDEFNRQVIAENLIKLFDSNANISPVVIDGAWGSGKSEFCKKFVHLSSEKAANFKCIYIDAFKYDQSDDPLLMLVSSISSLVEDKTKKTELLKKAIPVVKVFGKTAGKAAVSMLLKAKAEDLGEELSEAISSESEEVLDKGIKKIFENFEKVESNLSLYKKALTQIAKQKSIVLVIDELDRCRPSYALALLEKIKHVFDVSGVSFLLSTNLSQLRAMVKKQYGHEIDADVYLSKFFPLVVRLPEDHPFNGRDFKQNAHSLFSGLISSDAALKKNFNRESYIYKLFESLFAEHDRSLRDAERLFGNIMVFNKFGDSKFRIQENNVWMYVALMLTGIYIHTFEPLLAKKILRGQHTPQEVADFLGIDIQILNSPNERDFRALILALFVLDAKIDGFWIGYNEGVAKQWEGRVHDIFERGMHDPGMSNRVRIVQDSIRKLQFI